MADRDPWLDNARLVAVVGVVLGHCLTPLFARSGFAEAVWTSTWAFRVPVLVLLAGWFTSAAPLTRHRAVRLLTTIGLTYAVFEVLGGLTRWLATGVVDHAALDPLVPGFGLWFLFSLLLWRLAFPFLARVPHLAWWSVVAAVAVGFAPADEQLTGLVRTVAWFPLFLLGHRLKGVDLRGRIAHDPRARPAAVTAVVATALAGAALAHLVGVGALPMVDPYAADPTGSALLGLARLGVLAVGAVGAVAALALIPRHRIPVVTYLGTGSLFIYLLHTVLLPPLRTWGAFDGVDSAAEVTAMLAVATVVALALAAPPVRRLTGPLVRPYAFVGRGRRLAEASSGSGRVPSSGALRTAP